MARWQPLETLLLEYQRIGRDSFLAEHPHPVLILAKPEEEPQPHSGETQTEDVTVNRLLAADLLPNEVRAVARAKGFMALVVCKCEPNDWPDRITLGRSRSNDLVLPHRTVSKVHAYFRMDDKRRTTLTDATSRNGTYLNGTRLKPDRTTTVGSGDSIRVGGITVTFRTASDLCDFFVSILSE